MVADMALADSIALGYTPVGMDLDCHTRTVVAEVSRDSPDLEGLLDLHRSVLVAGSQVEVHRALSAIDVSQA